VRIRARACGAAAALSAGIARRRELRPGGPAPGESARAVAGCLGLRLGNDPQVAGDDAG
jgi:hypothetical protein